MKAPRIPPMLATIVQAGLVAVDSVTFGERATCPFCGDRCRVTTQGEKCSPSSGKTTVSAPSASR